MSPFLLGLSHDRGHAEQDTKLESSAVQKPKQIQVLLLDLTPRDAKSASVRKDLARVGELRVVDVAGRDVEKVEHLIWVGSERDEDLLVLGLPRLVPRLEGHRVAREKLHAEVVGMCPGVSEANEAATGGEVIIRRRFAP